MRPAPSCRRGSLPPFSLPLRPMRPACPAWSQSVRQLLPLRQQAQHSEAGRSKASASAACAWSCQHTKLAHDQNDLWRHHPEPGRRAARWPTGCATNTDGSKGPAANTWFISNILGGGEFIMIVAVQRRSEAHPGRLRSGAGEVRRPRPRHPRARLEQRRAQGGVRRRLGQHHRLSRRRARRRCAGHRQQRPIYRLHPVERQSHRLRRRRDLGAGGRQELSRSTFRLAGVLVSTGSPSPPEGEGGCAAAG